MNVLVIVVDTLRADHLGCYGYERATSPNLDAFAADGVVFKRMIAPAIPTHPAFTTIGTGQYSITHGIVSHGGNTGLPRTSPWLPTLMQDAGFTTCAVDNLADWRHGFGRSYEFYVDPTSRRKLHIKGDNREINSRAIPWLETHGSEPFYMMVHYWDPHTPYLPPRAYRTLFYKGDPHDPANHSLDGMDRHPLGKTWRETWFTKLGGNITDAEYIAALYDGEIRYCDEGIGQLLKAVDRLGLRESTLVVVMSDHGELMYRHGVFFDHHGLYDGNVRIPFIVRHPEAGPGVVEHLAAQVDIAPTVLDACGLEIPKAMEGFSLVPWIRGESAEPLRDFVVCQECTWQMKWAIRTLTHKFILAREEDFYRTPMRELYDLGADPAELHNIAGEDPGTAERLEGQLEAWIADKMAANGLSEDPLVASGLTLGRAWKEPQEPA
ncbi:MAG: sulfatase [Candidatus Hydrogenedentes bacterium]|nr:sulfatase [Candidatus Hydrogenedentota bacterium]